MPYKRNGGGHHIQLEKGWSFPYLFSQQSRADFIMNARRHSLLARNLIKACGGLEEASKASRLQKSQLSNAQNPNHDGVLPIDVVADLESYCGDPLYSRALVEACRAVSGSGDVVGEAIDVNAQVAALSSHIHHAKSDNIISPRESDEIQGVIESVRKGLARIESDLKLESGAKS